jgi:hypothetical protein
VLVTLVYDEKKFKFDFAIKIYGVIFGLSDYDNALSRKRIVLQTHHVINGLRLSCVK